jgi:hypothetical protein
VRFGVKEGEHMAGYLLSIALPERKPSIFLTNESSCRANVIIIDATLRSDLSNRHPVPSVCHTFIDITQYDTVQYSTVQCSPRRLRSVLP